MSEEKQNELNEQELWELLQDYDEEPATRKKSGKKAEKPQKTQEPQESQETQELQEPEKPQEAEVPEEDKPKTVITEKRKKALVWYLVGLFGIAFVVVLLSLFLKGGGRNPSTDSTGEPSAQMQELYDRINDLEEENTALLTENESLEQQVLEQQEMMDGLNLMIDEMSSSLEYVEGNQYADPNSDAAIRRMAAYETLVKAQAAFIDYDEEVLEQAMAELGENLDVLSQDAINAYYMVIEYMEQPYLGQE